MTGTRSAADVQSENQNAAQHRERSFARKHIQLEEVLKEKTAAHHMRENAGVDLIDREGDQPREYAIQYT